MNAQIQAAPTTRDDALFAAARINEIKARPVWDFADICTVFNIAPSTLEVMIREIPMAGLFTIGRRRHITQQAAHEWLEEVASQRSQIKPKTYNRRGQ